MPQLWVYVGDGHPAEIVYDYTADRSRAGPLAFLGDFRGYLQADAYAGYDALYATGRVLEVGCWAHARRYFWDAKASDPARALPALGFIQQLYAVEREGKGRAGPVRLALRIEQALPVLGRFRRWLDEQADVVLPKSPIGEAVGYARAQWAALTRYGEGSYRGEPPIPRAGLAPARQRHLSRRTRTVTRSRPSLPATPSAC